MNRLVRFPIVKPQFGALLRRNLFVQTEVTPNPLSLKFLPGREVLPPEFGTGMQIDRTNTRDAMRSKLAKTLFKLDGITSIFLGRDFITVTKTAAQSWNHLKPMIFALVLDFFDEEVPVIDGSKPSDSITDTTILESDDEVIAAIKELMETRVRPSVQEDGGDIFYHGFDVITGIVKVKLAGSCVGCPSSSVTLRNGVEKMLMHYIPEVQGIEEVTELTEEQKLEFKPDPVPTLENIA